MHSTPRALERVYVAATATLVPVLLVVHGLAAVLHVVPGISPGAVAVTGGVVFVGVVHALVQRFRPSLPMWTWLVAPATTALALDLLTEAHAGALALAICGSAQGWAQARLARALPESVDGLLRRHPLRAVGWALLAVLAVVQTSRLAAHQADLQVDWWVTTQHPDWCTHQCLAMYVYVADLNRQGQANIYADELYPPFEVGGSPTTVENLESHLQCGFEYPPPFLVLPRILLGFTNDFHVIRPIWFAINGLGFLVAAVVLGSWIGGARGRLALWLLPAVWCAVPTLQAFQFGQFHLLAYALALGGMLAFERRRASLGGALLAASVIVKIFPGVLLVLLATQRRWRELVATLIWMSVYTVAALPLLGTAPFTAFVTSKLPSMLDGSAFIAPADGDMMVAILIGITALPWRLHNLGLTFLPEQLGPWMGHALGLTVLAILWRARRATPSRAQAATFWLALLNLVVLLGPAAFCDYIPATNLWMLSLVSLDLARSRTTAILLGIAWIQLATLVGTFPFPDNPTATWEEAVSATQLATFTVLITLTLLALNLWCLLRAEKA